jgi:hypothetical protein
VGRSAALDAKYAKQKKKRILFRHFCLQVSAVFGLSPQASVPVFKNSAPTSKETQHLIYRNLCVKDV